MSSGVEKGREKEQGIEGGVHHLAADSQGRTGSGGEGGWKTCACGEGLSSLGVAGSYTQFMLPKSRANASRFWVFSTFTKCLRHIILSSDTRK